MLENVNIRLFSGGFYRSEPAWNKTADHWDQCYKFYFPTEGRAILKMDGREQLVETGKCYFISGFHIQSQSCTENMATWWIHFMPDSLYLRYALSNVPPFSSWDISTIQFARNIYTRLEELFELSPKPKSGFSQQSPPGLHYQMQSLLLFLIGDLLTRSGFLPDPQMDASLSKLQPAIDCMDERFQENPPLAEIAQKCHLAPNYFHRLFTQTFGITPFEYLLDKRLQMARQLLSNTDSNIKEIASQTGYPNVFYFIRTFKQHFGQSPSRFRKNEWKA